MSAALHLLRKTTLSQAVAVAVVGFLIAPFVVVLGASFDPGGAYQIHFPPRTLSLAAYAAIPMKYVRALGVSGLIGVCVAVLATFFGLLAALGIVRGRMRGKEVWQAFFRLPVQIPLIVTGAVFLQFYYQVAALVGINLLSGIGGIVVAHLFVATTYSVGAISAVLARVNPAIEEAAQSLGASNWAMFWQVTFPMLRPGLVAGLFYGFIMSFGDVPIAIFLVNADAMTLPVQIFQDMQFDFQPSMLATSAIVVVLSLILIVGTQKLVGLDLVMPAGKK
jgi:putative spermidine/putrescine transport system permease protein